MIKILEKIEKLTEFPLEIKNALTALDQENRQKIIMILLKNEKVSFSELKNVTNLKSSTLSFHLKKLMHASLIDNFYQKSENSDGNYSFYELTEFGRDFCKSILLA